LGERAEEFTQGHLVVDAVGAGSPCDLIAGAGGYVMLLGVTHTANTTVHVGEAYGGMRKLGRAEGAQAFRTRLPDGTFVEKMQDSSNSCSAGFNVLELPLRLRRMVQGFRLGRDLSSLMKGRDVIDCTVELLKEHPDITRCMHPACVHCKKWREYAGRR
jgi:aminoglycoside 3-N-acetyltransferase